MSDSYLYTVLSGLSRCAGLLDTKANKKLNAPKTDPSGQEVVNDFKTKWFDVHIPEYFDDLSGTEYVVTSVFSQSPISASINDNLLTISADTANTSRKGVVQLTNSISSSDQSHAATPKAVYKYVDNRISSVISGAPEALDTLKELADAISGDSNFAYTIVSKLNTKLNNPDNVDNDWHLLSSNGVDTKLVDLFIPKVLSDLTDTENVLTGVTKSGSILVSKRGHDLEISVDTADTTKKGVVKLTNSITQGNQENAVTPSGVYKFVDGKVTELNDELTGILTGKLNLPVNYNEDGVSHRNGINTRLADIYIPETLTDLSGIENVLTGAIGSGSISVSREGHDLTISIASATISELGVVQLTNSIISSDQSHAVTPSGVYEFVTEKISSISKIPDDSVITKEIVNNLISQQLSSLFSKKTIEFTRSNSENVSWNGDVVTFTHNLNEVDLASLYIRKMDSLSGISIYNSLVPYIVDKNTIQFEIPQTINLSDGKWELVIFKISSDLA